MQAIPVFFSHRMQAKVKGLSPSAHKPWAAVQSWIGLEVPLSIIPPTPVTREELSRAHQQAFVDAILDCREPNGFYTKATDVAASLPYTSGAMLCAAREAVRTGNVAVAPTCGFHHAGYAKADAFCTFNGLMVTALALKAEGLAQRVGILDLDQHYGDGTENIIQTLKPGFVRHYSSAEHFNHVWQAEEFLAKIPALVEAMKGCDVLLYQAGADPHVEDPLGGWLTTEQLAKRDRLVFESASVLRIPVAWDLAGGYQKPLRKVLDIHDNTMRACASTYLSRSATSKHSIQERRSPAAQNSLAKRDTRTQPAAANNESRQFLGPTARSALDLASHTAELHKPRSETPPLSKAGRKVADATLAAAKFTRTSDGKSVVRKYILHGMVVTEYISAEKAPDPKGKK
jgi:acetoin utilization deacetylase AcuC-like enzyme